MTEPYGAKDLSPEQSALDRAVLDELFALVPEDWTAFIATIEPPAGEGQAPRVTILHPERADLDLAPSPDLLAHAAGVAAYLARENRSWDSVSYAAHQDRQGAWHVRIRAPLPPAAPGTTPTAANDG